MVNAIFKAVFFTFLRDVFANKLTYRNDLELVTSPECIAILIFSQVSNL